MLQKNNKYKVLKIFFDNTTTIFGLREISRKASLALPSVKKYLDELASEGLIRKEVRKNTPQYIANRDSEKFKFYKILSIQYELFESGVIEYIWKQVSPEAIILYGSSRKGESIENSDIDLFVIGKKIEINLDKFEKILNKKIHLIINNFYDVPKELRKNLINGILLKGYINTK
ncbi:MAG: nucleotidyltransferase domain-containing protein [Nanoarchaeota archaeon]